MKKYFVLLLAIFLAACSSMQPSQAVVIAAPTATSWHSPTRTPSPPPTCQVSTGYDTGRLNIRTGAGVQYAVLRVLHDGDLLTMTGGQTGTWIEVVTGDDVTGWINSTFCRKEDELRNETLITEQ